jgi:hypothetical protein
MRLLGVSFTREFNGLPPDPAQFNREFHEPNRELKAGIRESANLLQGVGPTGNVNYHSRTILSEAPMSRRPLRRGHVDRDLTELLSVTKSHPGGARPKKSTLDVFAGLGGLALKISRDGYVSGEELATAIEADPGEALPDIVRDYLCRHLRGKPKKKPGPKKSDLHDFISEFFATMDYENELRRLQVERKTRGGRKIKGESAPHEEAAKIIKDRFKRFAMLSPRAIANLLSSRRSRG